MSERPYVLDEADRIVQACCNAFRIDDPADVAYEAALADVADILTEKPAPNVVEPAPPAPPAAPLRDPTPDELESPLFNAVWNAIKRWDISRTANGLYAGATGTDVCTILDAIKPELARAESELAHQDQIEEDCAKWHELAERAESELDALKAENQRLREALKQLICWCAVGSFSSSRSE